MVQRLQEQDRRNHEAYIRSGEIFEDRQQAYEKMTKSYEKLLASCQRCVDAATFIDVILIGGRLIAYLSYCTCQCLR